MIPTLISALKANHYDYPQTLIGQFTTYLELLQKWNKTFNLTAIRALDEMVILHLLDSLAITPFLHGSRIIDVGTGAGLPGIPLALVNKDKQFVLLDSNGKKTRFLTHVKQELGLTNIEVIHSRCEDFYPENRFDSILSRAFASIQVMLTTTQHLIDENGQFLIMKGIYPSAEIAGISPAFKLHSVYPLKIVGLAAERCLIKCIHNK